MTGTTAVPAAHLAQVARLAGGGSTGAPLCPACYGGHLHPYKVEISLSEGIRDWEGADYLIGWVAVCIGNRNYRDGLEPAEREEIELMPPCGFSLPMTPHLRPNRPAHEIDPYTRARSHAAALRNWDGG